MAKVLTSTTRVNLHYLRFFPTTATKRVIGTELVGNAPKAALVR
jgi:hypothetical protein